MATRAYAAHTRTHGAEGLPQWSHAPPPPKRMHSQRARPVSHLSTQLYWLSSVSYSACVQDGAVQLGLPTNSRCGQAFLASAMPISLHAAVDDIHRFAVCSNACAWCAQLPLHAMHPRVMAYMLGVTHDMQCDAACARHELSCPCQQHCHHAALCQL